MRIGDRAGLEEYRSFGRAALSTAVLGRTHLGSHEYAQDHHFDLRRDTKRVSFAKLREPLEVPNLLALQTESFEWLVGAKSWRDRQADPTPSGLDEILEEISPIEDFSGNLSLSFMDPRFDDVKANEEECRDKDMTYSAPLFVTAEFMNETPARSSPRPSSWVTSR